MGKKEVAESQDAMKQGLQAVKILKKCLERTPAVGLREVKDLSVAFQFVEHLEKAYQNETK